MAFQPFNGWFVLRWKCKIFALPPGHVGEALSDSRFAMKTADVQIQTQPRSLCGAADAFFLQCGMWEFKCKEKRECAALGPFSSSAITRQKLI